MSPHPRNTPGTRFIPDVVREPRQWWWGVRGGDPAVAEQDLRDLHTGVPLRSVAFIRQGWSYRQGLLIMHLGAPDPLTWRWWRPFRSHAAPLALPGPHEILDIRRTTAKEVLVNNLTQHAVLTVRTRDRTWTLAVVTIDLPVVRDALTGTGPQPGGAGW